MYCARLSNSPDKQRETAETCSSPGAKLRDRFTLTPGHITCNALQAGADVHGAQFRSDNERIWSTGAIFIPVSLAGFAALVAIDNPDWPHVLLLMFGSVSLMFIWLMVAENHKAFQRKAHAWLAAIEATLGLARVGHGKLPGDAINTAVTRVRVQAWRRIFLLLVILGWLLALSFTLSGLL